MKEDRVLIYVAGEFGENKMKWKAIAKKYLVEQVTNPANTRQKP
jgi:hypothetical protein